MTATALPPYFYFRWSNDLETNSHSTLFITQVEASTAIRYRSLMLLLPVSCVNLWSRLRRFRLYVLPCIATRVKNYSTDSKSTTTVQCPFLSYNGLNLTVLTFPLRSTLTPRVTWPVSRVTNNRILEISDHHLPIRCTTSVGSDQTTITSEHGPVYRRQLHYAKRIFYRYANAVFGRTGRISSEEVILQLIKSRCVPMLTYALEVCPNQTWKRCFL